MGLRWSDGVGRLCEGVRKVGNSEKVAHQQGEVLEALLPKYLVS